VCWPWLAMSGREWRLDQLFCHFPDVTRGTDRVLRCLWRTSGEGGASKSRRRSQISQRFLDRKLGNRFVVRFTNTWPAQSGHGQAEPRV